MGLSHTDDYLLCSHSSFVELRNGSLAAIGRSHDIDGTMPYALSTDGGYVWTAKKSEFTGAIPTSSEIHVDSKIELSVRCFNALRSLIDLGPIFVASGYTGIHGGEREVMIRLGSIGQPLMHCTFANGPVSYNITCAHNTIEIYRNSFTVFFLFPGAVSDMFRPVHLLRTGIPDSEGGRFSMVGVYCAVSFDDGDSWRTRKPITLDMSLNGRNQTGFDGHNFVSQTDPLRVRGLR